MKLSEFVSFLPLKYLTVSPTGSLEQLPGLLLVAKGQYA